MEYSERIKKIDALFDQMVALGVETLSVSTPSAKGSAYLVHDDPGDLREAKPRLNPEETCTIREANSPNGIRLILILGMSTERVYRETWGLDDGDE